jgi:hypothetical protein
MSHANSVSIIEQLGLEAGSGGSFGEEMNRWCEDTADILGASAVIERLLTNLGQESHDQKVCRSLPCREKIQQWLSSKISPPQNGNL